MNAKYSFEWNSSLWSFQNYEMGADLHSDIYAS